MAFAFLLVSVVQSIVMKIRKSIIFQWLEAFQETDDTETSFRAESLCRHTLEKVFRVMCEHIERHTAGCGFEHENEAGDCLLVLASIYIKRLVRTQQLKNPEAHYLQPLMVHFMLLSAVRQVCNFHYDRPPTNQSFAQRMGVALESVNQQEIEFMQLVEHKLHVTSEEYEKTCKKLQCLQNKSMWDCLCNELEILYLSRD